MADFKKELFTLIKKHNLEHYMIFTLTPVSQDEDKALLAIEGNAHLLGEALNTIMLENPTLSEKLVEILTTPIGQEPEEVPAHTLH